MDKYPPGPTVNAQIVRIAQEHFKTPEEAREAIHRAVDEISEDELRFARGVQVILMA